MFDGPAFLNPGRVLASSVNNDAVFRKYLVVVQDKMDFISRDTTWTLVTLRLLHSERRQPQG